MWIHNCPAFRSVGETGRESEEVDSSDSHVSAGFDDYLNDSAAVELAEEDPSDSSSISPPTTNHDVVAGFDEDIRKLMNRITDYSSSSYLQILPIVGMGGIGKSTLATHIYNHPVVMKRFDIRA